jgi:hypothetical protein
MAALAGKVAGFWRPSPDAAVSFTTEACTQVGATLEYYITDRTKAWWDPSQSLIVYDNGVPETPTEIDYAGGFVTLTEAPAGSVTVSGSYLTMEALLGGYGWKLNPKVGTQEITPFGSVLNTPAVWKEFIGTLIEWSGSVDYHWYTDGLSPEVRSSGEDVAKIDDSILAVFYTDIRTASKMALTGLAVLSGMDAASEVDGVLGGALQIQGTGRLRAVTV